MRPTSQTYPPTGTQLQLKFRSPQTLCTRPVIGHYLLCFGASTNSATTQGADSRAAVAVEDVSAACCDIPSELYDDKGQIICLPSGGFAGGDGRCPSGALAQSAMTVVWATRAETRR